MSFSSAASFATFGAPSSPATSSLWERRRASKQGATLVEHAPLASVHASSCSIPAPRSASTLGAIGSRRTSAETPRSEVDINVLSLVLEMPLLQLDRASNGPLSCPPTTTTFRQAASSASPLPPSPLSRTTMAASGGEEQPIMRPFDSAEALHHLQGTDRTLACEINTARTAVTSALSIFSCLDDGDDENEADDDEGHLRAVGQHCHAADARRLPGLPSRLILPGRHDQNACAGSPPSPTSPLSPADSTFGTDSEAAGAIGADGKKKGRARMSQEKRKRLARRREREALVRASMGGGLDSLPYSPTSPSTPTSMLPSDFAAYGLSSAAPATIGGVAMSGGDGWGRRSLDSLASRPASDCWAAYTPSPVSSAAKSIRHHQQQQPQVQQHQHFHQHQQQYPQYPAPTRSRPLSLVRTSSASSAAVSSSWDVFQPASPSSPSPLGGGWSGYVDLPSPSHSGFAASYAHQASSSSPSSSASSACSSALTTPQTSPTKYDGPTVVAPASASSELDVMYGWAQAQTRLDTYAKSSNATLRPPRLVVEPPSPQRGGLKDDCDASWTRASGRGVFDCNNSSGFSSGGVPNRLVL
ncbi:uncharacterized protein PFL1_04068 [Pseudozyma flocculosa PF-1]|uniref:Uncharacterized protein n=2 Tax=Pseudozyma flocculosa TaxID=84751 RepID=A0A5C3EU45_9BASI|nr:uncharacterized protein PFL1_04068 [Pseudozyma flocculosa PF-1]EPQ28241.1 hypothetical protein PFL1_04068 [Pseudozyma flocculosa PF-1]SPO35380.1 uncharacterized protein PSFLO_00851 [Pseudozyma flocculosa]